MTTKTLTFSDTRGGIHNTQSVELHEDLIELLGGEERLHISITLDSKPGDAMDTRIGVHGLDDINELADFLINLGHQIGHDLGNRCHIKDQVMEHIGARAVELDPDKMPEEIKEALGSLLEGIAEAARTTTDTEKAGK